MNNVVNEEVSPYQGRSTRAVISLDNLRNNFRLVQSVVGSTVKIMAIVKANAYGHGILKVAETLLNEGAYSLGVAYLEEALYLRKNGIKAPILVLGAINVEQLEDFIKNDIEITTSSIEKSEAISAVAQKMNKLAVVHLKIDTGLGRIGVQWDRAHAFVDKTFNLPNVHVKGVFSHLAKSDCDSVLTNLQIKRFNDVLTYIKGQGYQFEYAHLANSEGIINYPNAHYNMVRPGLILYGYASKKSFAKFSLKPVMSLFTKVAYFKVLPAGAGVGYNHTYYTKEQTRIITLPIGYADGYRRAFSNKAEIAVRGQIYKVAGNVAMDQITIDIGPDGTAYNGDEVLLFGENANIKLPLENLCKIADTIPYEILCNISFRVPRFYV